MRSPWAKLASTFDLGSTFSKAARSQEFFLAMSSTGKIVTGRFVAKGSTPCSAIEAVRCGMSCDRCGAINALRSVWCDQYPAIGVVRPMPCDRCGATNALRSVWCDQCPAIGVVQLDGRWLAIKTRSIGNRPLKNKRQSTIHRLVPQIPQAIASPSGEAGLMVPLAGCVPC